MAMAFFMQMELGLRQVGPVPPRNWQWHPSNLSFCFCLFSLYPSSFSYNSGFFSTLSKLLRLALKGFHALASTCLFNFFFLYFFYTYLLLHILAKLDSLSNKYTFLFPPPRICPCCSLFLKQPSPLSSSKNPTSILDEASLIPSLPIPLPPHILPFLELPYRFICISLALHLE